jgi:hypothetical protein
MKLWEAELDNKFHVEVTRLNGCQGQLVIIEAGKEIFSQTVSLSYGAPFGADIADINEWSEIAMKFVDGRDNG